MNDERRLTAAPRPVADASPAGSRRSVTKCGPRRGRAQPHGYTSREAAWTLSPEGANWRGAAACLRPLSVHRSPQIPAAARMLGINSSTCVQVAPVEIPRAGPGGGAREGTPTTIGIGGINSSASVQVAPVVILAARLGVGRADVPVTVIIPTANAAKSPKIPKRMTVSPCVAGPLARISAIGRDSAKRVVPPTVCSCRIAASFRFSAWAPPPQCVVAQRSRQCGPR